MNVSRCETCKIVIIKGLKVIDLKSKKSLKDTYSSCKSTVRRQSFETFPAGGFWILIMIGYNKISRYIYSLILNIIWL